MFIENRPIAPPTVCAVCSKCATVEFVLIGLWVAGWAVSATTQPAIFTNVVFGQGNSVVIRRRAGVITAGKVRLHVVVSITMYCDGRKP